MIQRHQPHAADTFARCSQCQREPKHVVCDGTTAREGEKAGLRRITPQRHQLECIPCGRSTARHPSLDACIDDWGRNYTQGELALVHTTRRRSAASY